MPEFPKHFTQTLALLKAKDPNGDVWRELEARHGESQRHFHTLDYLAFRLDLLGSTEHDKAHLRLALYYHHIFYDSCADNNEMQSARLATEQLSSVSVKDKDTAIIYDLIRITDPLPSPVIDHGDLFADLHLAWLGTAADQYRSFADGRRQEFSWLPDSKYLRQRMNEAMTLLGSTPIYKTESFHSQFEDQARRNLTDEITRLRG
jgi:predicted metal-dependent HD superfamily phosphohydrolase